MSDTPQEAVEFLRLASEAESRNRAEALDDLRFSFGDQWPTQIQNSRTLEARPCLTINELDAFVRQICNNQRQQRPRIKVHPCDALADDKIAEIMTGLCRHFEVNSDADHAYDNAFEFAVRMGWGYMRVVTDYIREDSFDQEIYIKPVVNPFTVYFDPESTAPDGSDAQRCLITDLIGKKEFQRLYPEVDLSGFNVRGTGDSDTEWVTKEQIRIAEYFKVHKVKATLVMLSNGMALFEDEVPAPEILEAAQLKVVGNRPSYKRKVMWTKTTSEQVLEEREWPGRYIPVIPVYGNSVVIEGQRRRFGAVRNAKDAQRMINFWKTAITELVALAPKAKWLIGVGQDEGFENEWAQANIKATPILHWIPTLIEGTQTPAPPPQRQQAEMPPEGAMAVAMSSTQDLQRVIGMFDPAMGKPATQQKSGTAIRAEQGQSDNSNFNFYDNLTRSIKHVGRICIDLVPKVITTKRVMRIIGDDGRPDQVTLNDKQAVGTIENDVTVGLYDVVMDTGPGYNTKRQEAFAAMMQAIGAEPQLMQVIGDLIFRNSDFPGADVIADRLAAANPLAQIDDKSDISPQAQMMIKKLQQTLQASQQQIQTLEMDKKYRMSVEKMRQSGQTQRTHMSETLKAHDIETESANRRYDTHMDVETKAHDASIKAKTSIDVEEIRAHLALLLAHIDNKAKKEATESADKQAVGTL